MTARFVVVRTHRLYQLLLGVNVMDTHWGWMDRYTWTYYYRPFHGVGDDTTTASVPMLGAGPRALPTVRAHASGSSSDSDEEDDECADQPHGPASRVHANARLLSQRGAELQALSQGAKPAKELRARIELERTRAAFFRSKRAPSVETGLVDPAHVDLPSMFGGATRERPISVTMVDRAISCPFRAFVERALGVRRAEELSDTHGPRERGTLLHRALHVAFDEDKRIRGTHSPEQRLLACRQVIEQELAREPFGVLRAEGVRRIREEAVAVVEFDLQREHDALYHKGEQRFRSREGSAYPALALRASNGLDVWLEGQIDRIDVNASGTMARVIDYKTGKVQTKRIGVTQLQLPLYAAVLRENGFSQTEACYISVGATGAISVQPSKPDEQKWPDDKLIDVKTQAADVIVSLWQGLVPPRPESPSACKHCEHRGICRRPAIALELEDE